MNPVGLLLLLSLAGENKRGLSGYFDTFKLELLLDNLHKTVDTLEKVNKLSQAVSDPLPSDPSPQENPQPKLDLQNAAESLAPLLSLLTNNNSSK